MWLYAAAGFFLFYNSYIWSMKKWILFLVITSANFFAFGQYFQTGQDPASIRWRYLDTKNFQLIYPGYYESEAQKLAGKLETVYPYGSYTLQHNPRKIPVVLHTRTVRSNGLVAWAPRRSEFFTTPHQSVYPQDWLEQLALHEFRHVVQINKVNSHLPRWIRMLLGEQGTALFFGLHLPWWLIEGDAVMTETALSSAGRGRLPSFLSEHRAQVVEKGLFSYDKAYFGSYKHYVPNHYQLGYHLAGNIRARYGPSLWEEVFTRAGSKPLSLTSTRHVLKSRTGMHTAGIYHSVFDSLKNVWQREDEAWQTVSFEIRTRPAGVYTSYNHNYWANDSVVYTYKTAFDEVPSLVAIDSHGNERKIVVPGTIFQESVGFSGEWAIWSERIPDLRWQHSGSSLIRMYHISKRRFHEIKPELKAFSPALSPDQLRLAVVETDNTNRYYLSVYGVAGGGLIHRFQTPENEYLLSPVWISNTRLALVVLTGSGKRLATADTRTGEISLLLNKESGDIRHLHAAGEWLYYIASWSGKNSLYRIHLTTRQVEQVYEPRFGVDSPALSPDGRTILMSDYTSDGFRLIEIPLLPDRHLPLREVMPGRYLLAEALAEQEPGVVVFADSTTSYPSGKYHKGSHLFNFHSWAPLFVDPGDYQFLPGVSLMSQNLLGTTETILGYDWDAAERTGRFTARHSFQGWYPVIDLRLTYGNRASDYGLIRTLVNQQGVVVGQDTLMQRYTWQETQAEATIRQPLRLDKGRFNRMLQPEVRYGFNHYKGNRSAPDNFRGGNFHFLSYRLYFHQLLRQSYLDMYPDFGVVLDATYRHSPGGSLQTGELAALQSVLYLPGIHKNHGLRLYGGSQTKTHAGAVGFSDVVRYARGWGRIATTGILTGGADYKLPLGYPDVNLFGVLYIRRLQAVLFGDYTRLTGQLYQQGNTMGTFTKEITSVGTELTANVNLIRFYAPSTAGIRASYLPELKQVSFSFLFSIDFTTF